MRQIVWGSILGIYLFAAGRVSWGAEYTSFNLRDPFKKQFLDEPLAVKPDLKPEAKEAVIPPQIVVDGIAAGGPTPYAIIGGRLLRIGDKVDAAVITAITKEGIEVVYKLEKFAYPSPSKALEADKSRIFNDVLNPAGKVRDKEVKNAE